MIGKTLLHYEIVQKLGAGGMGEVYRARDTKLNREVALKVLPPQMAADPERRGRFQREAQAVAALKHPNVVMIHSVEEADGVLFLTMELVEGKTLSALMPKNGFPLEKFFDLTVSLADALAAAHAKNITHRDLKPANIMLDEEGRIKVLDFGLAKLVGPAPAADGATLAAPDSATQEGRILGTAAYMSPEQAEGKPIDHRSDIFSLGIILFEMATGEQPFQGDTNMSTLSAIIKDTPATVTDIKASLPRHLARIIQHCLAKDPERRYQSVKDVRNELEELKREVDSGEMVTTGQSALDLKATSGPESDTGISSLMMGPAPLWKKPAFLGGALAVILLAVFTLPRLFSGGGGSVSPASANSIAVFSFENLKDPDDPERLGQILQELVITDLSGIDAAKVLSSQRLYEVQRQMGEKEKTFDKERITEVAIKAGAGRMLSGTLSQLGEKWILAAQLVDVASGEVVASKRIDGDDLYTMVDILTADIQSNLRLETTSEIEAVPVRDKTTKSLDAYKHYLAGVEHLNNELFDEAEKELQQAIEIDPDFGQAYYKLALVISWPSDNPQRARELVETVLSRKLYTSEKERRLAEGLSRITDNRWSEALAIYEQLTQDYPDDKEAWYGLGESLYHYFGGGREAEAVVAFKRAMALDPDFRLPLDHVFQTYQEQKQFDEAMAHAQRLIDQDPTDPTFNRFYAVAVAMNGDPAAIAAAEKKALIHHATPEEKSMLYVLLNRTLFRRGNIQGGMAFARKAAEANPEDVTLQRRLIGHLLAERRVEDYETAIFEGLSRNPDDRGFQGDARTIWIRRGEFEKAAAMAESLALAHPDDPRAARQWVWYAVQMNDEAGKARALDQAKRLHRTPDEDRALYLQIGGAYRQMGDFAAQRDVLDKVLAMSPEPDANLCFDLSFSSVFLRRLPEAKEWLARAEAQNPRHGGGLAGGVILNAASGDFDAAMEYVERIGTVAPKSPFYYSFRAYALLMAGRIDEAETVIDEAVKVLATPQQRYQFLTGDTGIGTVMTFLKLGDTERAEKMARRAVAVDSGAEAQGALGYCLLLGGDLEGGMRELRKGLQRTPREPFLLDALARGHLLNGETAKAREIWTSLIEHGPIRQHHFTGLGYGFLQEDRYAEALSQAERAAGMVPSRENRELLAWILVAGDLDVERGAEVARQAAEGPPEAFDPGRLYSLRAPAEETLGLVAMKREQYAEAVTWFEKAVAQNPNRPSIRKSLKEAQARATGAP